LVSYSRMLNMCKAAAIEAAKKGIQVEVIDIRTVKPLDVATIATSLRKTHRCVLVEEGHLFAGICAEIGFQLQAHCFDFLDAPIVRICQKETPMPYSKALEKQTLPTQEKILKAIDEVLR
ncbi:MAG: alpha-ketoacid dehydrogenase subunit beta, partial [Chlamydiae bacterium]|nr:alpha-ketoacid dehydrogenase subunit beta [Chlamydiota bacterium]